jgi:two-component system, cell cycle response regulator DivK
MTSRRIMKDILSLAAGDVSGWTVLIVDDQADNLAIARKVLSYGGARIYTAENGSEGLKALEDVLPSFILLDLSMPVMDGWDMLKRVRSDIRIQNIPVIALTAHAMAGDRERVMEAGFDGYIAKPFRLSTFMSEILRCFRDMAHVKAEG